MATQAGPLQKRVVLADGTMVMLPADALVHRTWAQIRAAHVQCDRCKEWERKGLSSTCPDCDREMAEELLGGPLSGTY